MKGASNPFILYGAQLDYNSALHKTHTYGRMDTYFNYERIGTLYYPPVQTAPWAYMQYFLSILTPGRQ